MPETFKAIITAQTTDGIRSVITDDSGELGEVMDAVAGAIAGTGEDNIVSIYITRAV